MEDSLLHGLDQIRTQLEYQNGITASIGCGTIIQDISQISLSVYQAVCAIESLHLCNRFNEIRFYKNMGVYRIFFQYQNDQELLRLYHTILGKLSAYDVENREFFFEGTANVDEFAIVTIGKYPYVKSVEVVLEEGNICVYMDTAFVASGTYLNDLHNSLNSEINRLSSMQAKIGKTDYPAYFQGE